MTKHELKLFDEKQIRTVWDEVEEKWYFCVADVIEALTDSNDVRQYIKRLRQRDSELNSVWGTICTPHQFLSTDGKRHATNCASIEGMLVHRLWMLLFGDVGGCQGGFRGTNRQKGGDITQHEAVS